MRGGIRILLEWGGSKTAEAKQKEKDFWDRGLLGRGGIIRFFFCQGGGFWKESREGPTICS